MPDALKDAALEFLKLVSAGKAGEAFSRFVSPNVKHHNGYFAADPAALMKAMDDNAKMFPNKTVEVQRALQDGDLVAVHSKMKLSPEDLGHALVHLFRFENGKIAEMWDVGMAVPDECPNENGIF